MIAAAVAVSWPALAATWIVHPDGTGDFPTIRAAVEGASSGDVIELADGIFAGEGNRDVDLLGKTLVIRSASGNSSSCILDCGGGPGVLGRAFLLQSGEGPGTAVEGLTIRNGRARHTGFAIQGGAILTASGAHLRIERCVFENNVALDFDWGGSGGAVHAVGANAEVIDCLFSTDQGGRRYAVREDPCSSVPDAVRTLPPARGRAGQRPPRPVTNALRRAASSRVRRGDAPR